MKNVLDPLVQALCSLPGVGPRSATRMAYYLLHQNPHDGLHLAKTIADTLAHTTHCAQCNTLTHKAEIEGEKDAPSICDVCANPTRDAHSLCIVEMPIDMHAMEQTKSYQGVYFVLMGAISPLDGIGADDIAIEKLITYVQKHDFHEIIIATNFTTQGETTAHYLMQRLEPLGILLTRLARGVPTGNELEYTDAQTIASALFERRAMLKF